MKTRFYVSKNLIKKFEIQNTEMLNYSLKLTILQLAFQNLKLSKNFIRINDSIIPIKPIKFLTLNCTLIIKKKLADKLFIFCDFNFDFDSTIIYIDFQTPEFLRSLLSSTFFLVFHFVSFFVDTNLFLEKTNSSLLEKKNKP